MRQLADATMDGLAGASALLIGLDLKCKKNIYAPIQGGTSNEINS